jgi:hypothetical protein
VPLCDRLDVWFDDRGARPANKEKVNSVPSAIENALRVIASSSSAAGTLRVETDNGDSSTAQDRVVNVFDRGHGEVDLVRVHCDFIRYLR